MNDKIPKRWFQLSLTTCIVMMVVAGVLVWANLKSEEMTWDAWDATADGRAVAGYSNNRGWPFMAFKGSPEWQTRDQQVLLKLQVSTRTSELSFWYASIDVAVAFTILAATAFACEWYTRRHARKQQEPGA